MAPSGSDPIRLRSLFLRAAELGGEERARFLDGLSGVDRDLRPEIEALLAADEDPEVRLPGLSDPDGDDKLPCLSRYRILGVVGEGGMGVVYRAEENGPLGRKVAVKVIRRELAATSASARFEAEAEALSLMDHPNVARVYDAGTTSDGRLYLAMEFVDGTPITTYGDGRRLGVDARIDLFLQVCDGIQHAHERGIIHRDLNPSNVLVAEVEGRPVAKIIDFGVAKLARPHLFRDGPHTEAGVLIGTPEYMSPEQVTMQPGAGDVRTDVWALGLLLYELLVGVLPYDLERLRGAGLTGLRTAILEQVLPTPVERLRNLEELERKVIAGARRTDARTLVRRVKGDLSRVAMKAIERDRSRRYPSAHELAEDVRRHRRLEPVLAGSPGTAYRVARFVRRHHRSLAASLAVTALAGSLALGAGLQARRASDELARVRGEARVAEKMARFVVEVLTAPATVAQRVEKTDGTAILDDGARRALDLLDASPLVRAQLLHAFGDAQRRCFHFHTAGPLLKESVADLDSLVGPNDPSALAARDSLARLYQDSHHYLEAERLFRRTYAARRDTLGDEHPETLRALSRLGLLLKTADRPAEAEPLLAECVAAMTRVLGPDQPDTLVVTSYYAGVLLALGRYQETLDLTRSLRPRADSVLGPRQIEAMATVYNQGAALARLGRPDEAVAAVEEAVERGFWLGRSLLEDADLESLHGRADFASVVRRHDLMPEFVYVHASFLREAGEYARSEALAREVLETVRRRQEGADTWGAEASYLLADVLFLQGRTDEAEPLVETLDARNLAAGSMAAYAPAEFVVFRAQCRLAQGDRAGAAALLQEAAARSASTEPGSAVVFYIASRQAALRGEEDRAAELLDRAGDRGFRLYWWLPREIVAAERGGLPAVAADLRARLEELRREARDRGETVEGIAAGSIRP